MMFALNNAKIWSRASNYLNLIKIMTFTWSAAINFCFLYPAKIKRNFGSGVRVTFILLSRNRPVNAIQWNLRTGHGCGGRFLIIQLLPDQLLPTTLSDIWRITG